MPITIATCDIKNGLANYNELAGIVGGLRNLDADVLVLSETHPSQEDLTEMVRNNHQLLAEGLGYTAALSIEYKLHRENSIAKRYLSMLSRLASKPREISIGNRSNAILLESKVEGYEKEEPLRIIGMHFGGPKNKAMILPHSLGDYTTPRVILAGERIVHTPDTIHLTEFPPQKFENSTHQAVQVQVLPFGWSNLLHL